MTQNRSAAVMQQRSEPHDSLDDFPTPPWATRAALQMLGMTTLTTCQTVREPCANRGHMVKPLREVFSHVEAADIFDYGAGFAQADYLFGPPPPMVNWTFANPPFRLADQFIRRALDTSRDGVAIFVRSAFTEGETRYQELFRKFPPTAVLQFSERVVIHKGRLPNPNKPEPVIDKKTGAPKLHPKTGEILMRKPSSATAYCWIIWKAGANSNTIFDWIPPCREKLERPGDYPE
ncbi:putative DNA methyltransferase protein [Nostoc phage Nsp-JY21]